MTAQNPFVTTLPNGLKIVVEQRKGTGFAQVGLFIRCGNMDDPEGYEGLASLNADTLIWGVPDKNLAKAMALQDAGCSIKVQETGSHTEICTPVIPDQVPDMMDLLAAMVQSRKVPRKALTMEQQTMAGYLTSALYRTESRADLLAQLTIYQNQQAGRVPTHQSLANITPALIKAQRDALYVPNNMVLSIVGDVDPQQVFAAATHSFGRMKPKAVEERPVPVFTSGVTHDEQPADKTQIRLVFPGIGPTDPDAAAASLLAMILGGGMSSRLFKDIREDKALVYKIQALNVSQPGAAYFTITAATDSSKKNGRENRKIILPAICHTLVNTTHTITDEEVEQAIQIARQDLNTQNADSAKAVKILGTSALNRPLPFPLAQQLAMYQRVSAPDIERVARRIFSGSPALIASGPCKGLASLKKIQAIMQKLPPASKEVPHDATRMTAQEQAMPIQTTHTPNVQTTILDNGLRIAVDERPGSGVIHAGIWVHCGSGHEPQEQAGIAHFIEHMAFKGTRHYSAAKIRNIEQYGGRINATTFHDSTGYYTTIFPDQFGPAMRILEEIVALPKLSRGLEKERRIILEELMDSWGNPANRLFNAAMCTAFTDQPWGSPVIGWPKTIEAITPPDLQAFHARHYVPANMVLALSGDITMAEVVAQVPLLASLPSTKPAPVSQPVHTGGNVIALPTDGDFRQALISFPAFSQEDKDNPALEILHTILERRLMHAIVNEHQLACTPNVSLLPMDQGGHLIIHLDAEAGVLQQALPVFYDTCRQIQTSATSKDIEIARSQACMKDLINREQPKTMCEMLGFNSVCLSKFYDIDISQAQYAAITPQDIIRVARRIFSGLPACAILGNEDDLPLPKKIQAMLRPAKKLNRTPQTPKFKPSKKD